MTFSLKIHQARGVEIGVQRPRYGWGWKPGCGKTILSWGICDAVPMKSVVVCPPVLVRAAWMKDCGFFPKLKPVVIHEQPKPERTRIIQSAGWDTVIITPEIFRKHADDLLRAGVKRLFFDESSKMRNPEAKITKAVHAFSDKIDSCYMLSGTMAPNNVTEYWGSLRPLGGPKSRSYWQFAYEYAYPVKVRQWMKNPKTGRAEEREVIKTWLQTEEHKIKLQAVLERWVQFLRLEDCVDMPPQSDMQIEVVMTAKEATAYKAARDELRLETSDGRSEGIKAGAALMKMRQLASGMVITPIGVKVHGSSKLEALGDILDEIGPDESVVIWAEFTHEIDAIVQYIKDRGESVERIDGHKEDDAHHIISRFQSGGTTRLVCHPASVGHGATLTKAKYDVEFSGSFSRDQFEQKRCRIYRIGQHHPVVHYQLIAVLPGAAGRARNTTDYLHDRIARHKMEVTDAIEAACAK